MTADSFSLFHVEQELWHRVATFVGAELTGQSIELLSRFATWLGEEAIPAGAVSRHDLGRIGERHVADSLLFAVGLEPEVEEIWDLGSGVGLPGIPLAILLPRVRMCLVDRSARRIGLARRAVRVLGLSNVTTREVDLTNLTGTARAIVSRAALPPVDLAPLVEQHLTPPGTAVVGGSWVEEPRVPGWETLTIPPFILDRPVWLLIMRRQ